MLNRYRLGYACHNMNLESITAAHRITLKKLKTLSREEQLAKLRIVLRKNLEALRNILEFNVVHGIKLYRIPSELVPLATHEITSDWDYFQEFANEFEEIGNYIKEHELRVTIHVTQYTFLNSNREEVASQAVRDIHYHSQLLDQIGLDQSGVVVIHVGGVYGNKEAAIDRFIDRFSILNDSAKRRIVIENDDKSFDILEVLKIARKVKVPALFDYHHYRCLDQRGDLKEVLIQVKETWGKKRMKIHYSSPKSQSNYRSHSEYINSDNFMEFINSLKKMGLKDIDIMLECKAKDKALFKLQKELKIS